MILMIIFVDLLSVIPCFVVLAADLEFILYYMCVCLVDWSYLTLCNPMGCSLPGSSVHGFLQARLLEWVAIPFSTGSAPPRDQTQISCIAGGFFTVWSTREAHTILYTYTIILYIFKWSMITVYVQVILYYFMYAIRLLQVITLSLSWSTV